MMDRTTGSQRCHFIRMRERRTKSFHLWIWSSTMSQLSRGKFKSRTMLQLLSLL